MISADPFTIALSVAFGGALVVSGGLAIAGRTRRWLPLYLNPAVPLPLRNAIFVTVPLGVAFLLVGLVAAPVPMEVRGAAAIAAILLVFGSIGAAFRPPDALKPRWLQAAERSGEVRSLPADRTDNFLLAGFVVLTILLVVSFAAILLPRLFP